MISYKKLRLAQIYFIPFIFKYIFYRLVGKNIIAHNKAIIKGLKNIETNGRLSIGLNNVGFLNKHDRTYLNIRGKLIINGEVNIEKGCRFDIGENAICILNQCSINGYTTFIISHGIEIGDNSFISWGCEIIDEDFHKLFINDCERKMTDKKIIVGKHVWVGSHSKIYKGVKIGDNSIIAANSMVISSVPSNIMVGGIPAKKFLTNVHWK
jgi:acetyltransferase-like isoleucine patch superfamily enzyme